MTKPLMQLLCKKPFWMGVCFLIALIFSSLVSSCSNSNNHFKVAATPVPHAELLEFVKPELKSQGIDLEIVIIEDYNIPNRALAQGEVDANFFQHLPFLEEQIKQFDYPIQSVAKIELEPMGLYSRKIHSLSELAEGAAIAIPNDPTNEARALNLLMKNGVIELDDPNNLQATILNITKNQKHLKFFEIDAAMLPRVLGDVDAAAINTNYALAAHLSPSKDALAIEANDSPYVNIIAVRIGDEANHEVAALKKAMTSEKMRDFILKKYKGTILPAF